MITRDEIFSGVSKVLCESQGLEPSEVKLDSKLVGDIDLSSIDFLDLSFRLERLFGIKKLNREGLMTSESDWEDLTVSTLVDLVERDLKV